EQLLGRRLRLLAKLVEEPPGELVVVNEVPVVGPQLQGRLELVGGPPQKAEPRIRILFSLALLEECRAHPEVACRGGRNSIGLLEHRLEGAEPVLRRAAL